MTNKKKYFCTIIPLFFAAMLATEVVFATAPGEKVLAHWRFEQIQHLQGDPTP